MSSLSKEAVVKALVALGKILSNPNDELTETIYRAENANAWFTVDESKKALASLGEMLNAADLEKWMQKVNINSNPKKVGLILAGNIPMVGFHDVLSVLVTGNIAMIKMSSSDDRLIPTTLKLLVEIEPAFANQIQYVERLQGFDAIIATGSNNSSRYFDYYFGKVPNIIRKNRNSIAILTGEETPEQIEKLGHDIFDYFGLGCRNISKVYFPEGYQIKNFFEPLEKFQPIINHFKYNNNYDYNKSIYLVNSQKHFDNGFLLLKEDESLTSPLATLFYEEYSDLKAVENRLDELIDQIQCVVSASPLNISKNTTAFGKGQHPKLWDYADDVDTIAFLNSLAD